MKRKPKPFRLTNSFNILFSQAQEIKRLRAESEAKDKTIAAKDNIILEMQRHAKGIIAAWDRGILSSKDLQ